MRPLVAHLSLLSAPLALATLAAGCGGDPVDAEPKTISFDATRTALLAVREEGGDWRALTPAADGSASTVVEGPYTVASVCDTGGFFDYYTIHAAPEDADVWQVWCGDEQVTFVDVTIDAAQVGTVHIGYARHTAGETASVTPGRYDLVAIDDTTTPPRVAIQRDVQITAAMTISIDVAAHGGAANPVAVTVDGAADAPSTTRLTTDDRTIAILSPVDGQAFLIPASLMVDGDFQRVSSGQSDGPGYRYASALVAGDETAVSLALPAGITSATYTPGAAPSVTWAAPQAFDDRYFYIADDEFTRLWDVMMFGGYVEALGVDDTLAIPDPTEIPGWNAAWTTNDLASWFLDLSTTTDDGSTQASSWDSARAEERRAHVRPYAAAQRAGAARR